MQLRWGEVSAALIELENSGQGPLGGKDRSVAPSGESAM